MSVQVGNGAAHPLPRVCYLMSGYTSHARAGAQYQEVLRNAGVPLVRFPAEAEVVIIHDEAPQLPNYIRAFPELSERYLITYAVWEASTLPANRADCLGLADEIWTCSEYCQNVFSQVHDRVMRIPHVIPAPQEPGSAATRALRDRIGVDDTKFVFYTIATRFPRKNLSAAIQAFAAMEQDTHFVIKTDVALSDLGPAADRVTNLHGTLGSDLIDALHSRGNCFVSAHCGEGWGLGLSEALARGNNIVATAYGGCMDFLSPSNARLVEFDTGPLQVEERQRLGFAAADTTPQWAYPKPDSLQSQMQEAYRERMLITDRQIRATSDANAFSPDRIGALICARLGRIEIGTRSPAPRQFGKKQTAR